MHCVVTCCPMLPWNQASGSPPECLRCFERPVSCHAPLIANARLKNHFKSVSALGSLSHCPLQPLRSSRIVPAMLLGISQIVYLNLDSFFSV